jgi:hypothetical protein
MSTFTLKLVKSDGSDTSSAQSNTAGCINTLLHSMFSFLNVSLNGKPVTLHETIITRLTLKNF